MKSRHHAREIALQILYQYDMEGQGRTGPAEAETQKFISDLTHHFEHFEVPQELREFVAQLVVGTVTEVSALDAAIEKHAANWKLNRMPIVDRSLLRMAIYEMTHFPDTAASIVIDEAIELAKQFGTEETPGFVNGILDAVMRNRI
ncbi:MAG: transcription antitermination factor NusB [Bdellovibrionales bacterium RIFOXYC1_FULL_54_43]|nr:MAG: transcription antitermination factor NusB [Bdellovibrionales bacterium RIFOXYC1_FULL_54_43]OFZ83664.1 MAG: transcription antitermination factor NusB [Bdellovibrionales bacterium RIFOXYD1_FULL_55_31]